MSPTSPRALPRTVQNRAHQFAALGDETRLMLVGKLCDGQQHSISALSLAQPATAPKLTRQAITKHLRVLERARLIHEVHRGRETLFELNHKALEGLQEYLDVVSRHWNTALARLKSLVEE